MSGKKKRRRRKPKNRKPVFQSRPKLPEPDDAPADFTINLGDLTQSEAYGIIQSRLEAAKLDLPEGYDGRVMLHAYVDGSVDGELYVRVPDDDYQGNVNWDLQKAFGEDSLGRKFWVSMGARFTIETDDEVYRRYKGLNSVGTHFQRASATNIAEEGLILRKKVLPGMKKHFHREAHSIFIRLHWNPQNEQPKR